MEGDGESGGGGGAEGAEGAAETGHGVAQEMAAAIVAESRRGPMETTFSLLCREGSGETAGVEIARVKITGGSRIAVRAGKEEALFSMEQIEAAVEAFLLTSRRMRSERNRHRAAAGEGTVYGPIWFYFGDTRDAGTDSRDRQIVFTAIESSAVDSIIGGSRHKGVMDRIIKLFLYPPAWKLDLSARPILPPGAGEDQMEEVD